MKENRVPARPETDTEIRWRRAFVESPVPQAADTLPTGRMLELDLEPFIWGNLTERPGSVGIVG